MHRWPSLPGVVKVLRQGCGNFLDLALDSYLPLFLLGTGSSCFRKAQSCLQRSVTQTSLLYCCAWQALLGGCEQRHLCTFRTMSSKRHHISLWWVSPFPEFVSLGNDSQGGHEGPLAQEREPWLLGASQAEPFSGSCTDHTSPCFGYRGLKSLVSHIHPPSLHAVTLRVASF